MKRLITILLSFIGCVSLYGQAVPMVVAGNVHISGTMYSAGAVHVYAKTAATVDTGKIEIDNSGATAMLVTDTIILYSNDTSDGLVRNLNVPLTGGGVKGIAVATQPYKVIMRKAFAANPVHTYFSVPFDVAPSSILVGGTQTQLDYNNLYGIWGFDAKTRAGYQGYKDPNVWKELNYAGGEIVKKGMGYQLWYGTGGVVDFVTLDPTAIKTLFDPSTPKTVNYTMYTLANPQDVHQAPLDEGWAFIGGLNSTTFVVNKRTISGYTGATATAATVYIRMSNTSQATGSAMGGNAYTDSYYDAVVVGMGDSLNINPYSPVYIQGNYNAVASVAGTPATFTFNSGGLLLQSAQYRSSQADSGPQDQLYFALSSDKDSSFDRFYLNFADNYNESYLAMEDAVKLSTAYESKPAVWSVLDGMNQPLVVNGLPMKDGRKVEMGFSVPKAGDYTISLDALHQQDVKSVILVDNVTGKPVDLLQTPYSFSTGAVDGENGRFVLYINSSITGIPSISSNGLYAYVKDNILTVKNLSEGDRVQVLDLSGRVIASGKSTGKEFSATLSQKGVYVVNVTGGKALKVLNK